jgi:hypothetical protein
MATSSVPDAHDALEELLKARFGKGVVEAGIPLRDPGKELLMIGDVEGDTAPVTVGRNRRAETYTIDVIVSVVRPGGNQRAANARAWELVAELEELVQEHKTLGGVVLEAGIAGSFTFTKHGDTSGTREARIRVPVACKARI